MTNIQTPEQLLNICKIIHKLGAHQHGGLVIGLEGQLATELAEVFVALALHPILVETDEVGQADGLHVAVVDDIET